ncbi:MFS transporter [Nocardia acidivorans]|uniref:MFS transporter n=1 Tax=Nocardia acidivorans TaxID=404580 RepID=UPI000A595106|nr:MFS transporter [Nocardia acidivorans]
MTTPIATDAMPRRGRNLALLTASHAMDNAETSVISVLFPMIREALGLSATALGALVAAGKIVGTVAALPWVFLARRYRRKNVLAICAGFWGLWAMAAGLSTTFAQLLILTTLAAAGFAGAGPIALGMVGDLYDDSGRGRATGMFYAGTALATGIAAPLFGRLSGIENGWCYGFFLSGGVCVIVGVLILLFLRDPGTGGHTAAAGGTAESLGGKARTVRAGLRELFGIPTFRLILVQRLCSGQNVIMSFGTAFLVHDRGFSTATASMVALPFALGYIAGTLIGGRVNDRVHRALPSSGRIIMLQLSQLAFAAAAFLAIGIAWASIGAYVAIFAMVGFLQGQVPVVNRPLVMAVVPAPLRPLGFAVSVSAADGLAYGLYSLLTGVLGDAIGLEGGLLLVTVVLTTVNGLACATLYRPYARDSIDVLRTVHH